MKRMCRLISLAAFCCVCGCQAAPPPVAGRAAPVYLLHLPGTAGDTLFDDLWVRSLKAGGAADETEVDNWTGGRHGLFALRARRRNQLTARIVAQRLAERMRARPNTRVVLTGSSGGSAVAIWALEQLPAGMQVQTALLVAPAMSPDYDLTAALRHVRGHLYVVTSPADVLVLGIGTQLFGTMDGRNTVGAGLVGFRQPTNADAKQYAKLVDVHYRLSWVRFLNFGDHIGALSPAFARHYLAPLLRSDVESGRITETTVAQKG